MSQKDASSALTFPKCTDVSFLLLHAVSICVRKYLPCDGRFSLSLFVISIHMDIHIQGSGGWYGLSQSQALYSFKFVQRFPAACDSKPRDASKASSSVAFEGANI